MLFILDLNPSLVGCQVLGPKYKKRWWTHNRFKGFKDGKRTGKEIQYGLFMMFIVDVTIWKSNLIKWQIKVYFNKDSLTI